MEQSKTTIFFKQFRNKSINEFEIYVSLKKISENFNKVLLDALKKELIVYLKKEKKILTDSISKSQIEVEVKKLESNDKPVPKFGQMSGVTKRNITNPKKKKKTYLTPNIEAIMFPKEFMTLYTLQKIIDERILSSGYETQNIEVDKIDTEVFSSYQGYELFIYLLNQTIDLNNKLFLQGEININLSKISFIYRKMYDDGLFKTYVKDTIFRKWLNDNFEIVIDQTKTLSECSPKDRMNNYNTSMRLFRLQ